MSVYTATFAKAAARATPPSWDRTSYAEYLRKAGDVVRVTEDRKLLRALMRRAKKSPTAQSALAWAKAHGIKIVVDRTTNLGGYYQGGSGVVALSLPLLRGELKDRRGEYYDVEVLVHEIRHAWQDHKGLLSGYIKPEKGDLAVQTIRQALYEADANAHGRMANFECESPQLSKHWRPFAAGAAPVHEDYDLQKNYLRTCFEQWFAHGRGDFYGVNQMRFQAAALGLTVRDKQSGEVASVKAPNYQTELPGLRNRAFVAGLDPWRSEDIAKLGSSFSGVNYLAGWRNDALWRRILSPASAVCQFADVVRKPHPLALAVRKKQLRDRVNFGRHHRILTLRGYAPKPGGRDF